MSTLNSMDASTAISRLIDILSSDSSSFREEIEELRRKRERIIHDVIRVGVLGVTSAGKSTLINALLGEELLPAEAKPSSSQLVSCRKGKEREAKVYFTDNRIRLFRDRELTSNIISKYGNENNNQKNKERVSQIEIISPYLRIPTNVELVDSPGLDAYGLDGHEQITMETLLPSVDFCIFVTTCKTNSDKKMLTVLNAVARYDKPIIIVQNMIDSLRGTPDGSKSVDQVAQEHIGRIRRIVNVSNISNKSSVHILQMSAKYALACRKVLLRNRNLSSRVKAEWEKSGFEAFAKLLDTIPNALAANVERNWLSTIRLEITRIISQTDISDINQLPVDTTNYQAIYDGIIRQVYNSIANLSKLIDSYISEVKKISLFTQSRIDDVKRNHSKWTSDISNVIRTYNEDISSLCKRLNISTRDLRYSFIPSQASTLRIQKKTITTERKQKGFWGGVKRFFTFGTCGYETVSEEVNDWDRTYREIISFLEKAKSDYTNQLNQWYNNNQKSNTYIIDAIHIKEKQTVEAKKRKMDAEKKQIILTKLRNLLNDMPVPVQKYNIRGEEHSLKVIYIKQGIFPMTFLHYLFSKKIVMGFHRKIFDLVFNNHKIRIYSWDDDSRNLFLSEFAGLRNDEMLNLRNGNSVRNIKLANIESPLQHSKDENAVVFVNLTQPGAAKTQINKILNSCRGLSSSDIIFVIQDLQEVITGGDLRNALSDMTTFFKNKLYGSFRWFSMHANPLYNIALWEIQQRNIRNQNDEITVAHELKKLLSDFYQPNSDLIIADLIRGLH